MDYCDRIILKEDRIEVCQEPRGTGHSHADVQRPIKRRELKEGEAVVCCPRGELALFPFGKFMSLLRAKADAGHIAWHNDAPLFWGMLHAVEVQNDIPDFPKPAIIVIGDRVWGRGATIQEAAEKAGVPRSHLMNPKKAAIFICPDPTTEVHGTGGFVWAGGEACRPQRITLEAE